MSFCKKSKNFRQSILCFKRQFLDGQDFVHQTIKIKNLNWDIVKNQVLGHYLWGDLLRRPSSEWKENISWWSTVIFQIFKYLLMVKTLFLNCQDQTSWSGPPSHKMIVALICAVNVVLKPPKNNDHLSVTTSLIPSFQNLIAIFKEKPLNNNFLWTVSLSFFRSVADNWLY